MQVKRLQMVSDWLEEIRDHNTEISMCHYSDVSHVDSSVCTVAVCAGSGASVLNGVKADLYITGRASYKTIICT